MPYNVSIILKLTGHIKRRLIKISTISNFFKNLSIEKKSIELSKIFSLICQIILNCVQNRQQKRLDTY